MVAVPLGVYERDRAVAGSVLSAAIALRLFMFFVPLVLFVVGVAGFLGDVVGADDVDSAGITGRVADQIGQALDQPNHTRWLAVLTGLTGMVTTGRTLSRAMLQASCLVWRIPVEAKPSARLVGSIVGLVVGLGIVSVLVNVVADRRGLGLAGASFLGAAAIYLAVWMLVSIRLPRAAPSPGSLLPGATLVAVVLAGLQAVSQLYLPNQFERASSLYGAIGSSLVVLGWFFILGRTIVLSFELNADIFERYGSVADAAFRLPVLRRLRRWQWVRKLFDLD
jgi:uncharacterized BrkB/YihY/UPF0761 family membrane protein